MKKSLNTINSFDPSGVLECTGFLANQIEHAWEQVQRFKLPEGSPQVRNVVVFGMGGSALGAHIIQSLYGTTLSVPFLFISGYEVSGFVGSETVAILSSYSGTTEEVLRAAEECEKRGAYVLGLTIGGDLAKKLGRRAFIFKSKYNSCGHPRLGLGYMTFGLLGLLQKLDLVKVSREDIEAAIILARRQALKFSLQKEKNSARKFAKKLQGYNIIVVASEFLVGNAHVFANQLNETAKNFANYFVLPELNHHLMEALRYPLSNKKNLKFVFVESDLYSPSLRLRYKTTKDVVRKNGIKLETIKLASKNKMLQVVEMLTFSGFVSFYLAMLGKVNPGEIPWVNYFKKAFKALKHKSNYEAKPTNPFVG